MLDDSRLGEALLSDHSGVFWTDGQTKLSFGRVRKFAQPAQEIALIPAREAVRSPRPACWIATCWISQPWAMPGIRRTRRSSTPISLPWPMRWAWLIRWVCSNDAIAKRWWCSPTARPWGINANLPRFVWQEVGQGLALGSGDGLSATPHRLIRVEVLERAYAEHPGSVTVSPSSTISAKANSRIGSWPGLMLHSACCVW